MSYERMDAVIKQHRDTMAQIHSELTSLQSKVEELKQENEELKEQCIELKDDNAELTTEKQKAMEPWLGDDWQETTLADWADDIEKQKAEITDDYQREIEALEEENEKLKEKLDKIKEHYDKGELSDSWILNDDFTITLED